MHPFLLIIGVSFFIPQSEGQASAPRAEKPEALVAMERARLSLRTARVDWTDTHPRQDPVRERFYTSRCAGEDFIVVDRGDAEGVLHWDEDGNPMTGLSCPGPRHCLVRPGKEAWIHKEDSLGASVCLEKEGSWTERMILGWDIRALGATPWTPPAGGSGVRDALRLLGAEKAEPATYTSESAGRLHKVVAYFDRGWSYEYLIDAGRGWNPTRMDMKRKGENPSTYQSVRITLEKFGETWFPRLVVVHKRNRSKPERVIRVLSAAFNQEDHPKKFSVRDIGIDVGTNIKFRRPPDWSEAWDPDRDLVTWDGEKLIPYSEFVRLMRVGKLEYGPDFSRASARLTKLNERKKELARRIPQPPVSSRRTILAYTRAQRWDGWFERVARICEFSTIQINSGQAILKELRKRVYEKKKALKSAYPTNYADAVARFHAERFTELVQRVGSLLTPEQFASYEKEIGDPLVRMQKEKVDAKPPKDKSGSKDP